MNNVMNQGQQRRGSLFRHVCMEKAGILEFWVANVFVVNSMVLMTIVMVFLIRIIALFMVMLAMFTPASVSTVVARQVPKKSVNGTLGNRTTETPREDDTT